MSGKVGFGIIGIGNMGSNYATKVTNGECPDFELVAVADISPKRQNWAKENLNESVKIFTTAEEMLDSGMLDACMVETPHYDHPLIAMEALKAGLHVLSEKPVGVFTKNIRELNELAAKSGKAFQ